MTEQELAQARLEKAREIARSKGCVDGAFTPAVQCALAALTEGNWRPPVDPDLLIAREAVAQGWDETDSHRTAERLRAGENDGWSEVIAALAAIKLFKARQS